MTQPSWLPLATLAIRRLERLTADDQPSQWPGASTHSPEPWEVHEPGRNKGFSPTAALARVPSAMLAPCEEGEALARGEEVYTPPGDEAVRQPDIPQPKVLPPLDRLVLVLRLSVLFGSVSAVRAILQPGAVTLLAHGDVPEGDVRHVLDEALLPDGRTTTVSWASKSVAAGDLGTLSLGTVEMARRAVRDGSITTLLGQSRAVLILVPHPHDLPDDLKRILPHARVLPPVDREILSVLLGVTHSASADKLDVVARLPDDPALARLGDAGLLLALRAPTAGAVAERLTTLLTVPSDPGRPTLERIEGYGAAEAVARQMLADLLAWREPRRARSRRACSRLPWHRVRPPVCPRAPLPRAPRRGRERRLQSRPRPPLARSGDQPSSRSPLAAATQRAATKTPRKPPTTRPARNSSIAAEPALDPVAQADQAQTEEHEPCGRGVARAGKQRD